MLKRQSLQNHAQKCSVRFRAKKKKKESLFCKRDSQLRTIWREKDYLVCTSFEFFVIRDVKYGLQNSKFSDFLVVIMYLCLAMLHRKEVKTYREITLKKKHKKNNMAN